MNASHLKQIHASFIVVLLEVMSNVLYAASLFYHVFKCIFMFLRRGQPLHFLWVGARIGFIILLFRQVLSNACMINCCSGVQIQFQEGPELIQFQNNGPLANTQ